MTPMLSVTMVSWTLLALAMTAALVVAGRAVKRAPRRVPVRTRAPRGRMPAQPRDPRGCDWR